MRTSGVTAMIAFGALCVGFGAGWIVRSATSTKGDDDVSSDAPARKPASTASIVPAATIAKTPSFFGPKGTLASTCNAPAPLPFSWPPTVAPYDDVVALDDAHFVVDTAYLNELLENQAEMMKSARLVPETADGGVVGVRVYGVRPSSALDRLGVRDGDTLLCLNEWSLDSPDQALEAYGHLRTATEARLALVRSGKPLTLEYRLTTAPAPSTSAGAKPKKHVDLDNPF